MEVQGLVARVPKETVVRCVFPVTIVRPKGVDRCGETRYCERVHAQYPVVFAGEAYVGSYLEMRMLFPDRYHASPPSQISQSMLMRGATVWCRDSLRVGSSKMSAFSRCHLDTV
jgi:hypothetical protein